MIGPIVFALVFIVIGLIVIRQNGKDKNEPMPPEAFQGRWGENE